MQRLRLAVLTAFLAFAAFAAAATAAVDPAVRAKDFLDALKAGQFEKAAIPFDATMKAALPPSGLERTWAQLRSQVGALKSEGPLRAVKAGGMTTILQRL